MISLGTWEDGGGEALSQVELTLPALDFVVQWRRCGMTADFLADYLCYAFDDRDTARSVLSTVANELLENAAKFSANKREPVRVQGRLRGDYVELEARNVANADHVAALTRLFEGFARDGAERLFAAKLEAQERGGLGLIILAKDYRATLGARLEEPRADGLRGVTVRAAVPTAEVEQREVEER